MMQQQSSKSLTAYGRSLLTWLQKTLTRRSLLGLCMLTALCAGLLGHGFAFTNKLYASADEVFYFAQVGSMFTDLGRFGLALLWKLGPQVSVPWFNGICGIALCGLAACLVCSAVGLRQRWQVLLVSALLVLHPVIMTAYNFMFMALGCMTAIFLCACALWCLCRLKPGFLWAIPFLTLAIGVYQVFLMFAASLMIFAILRLTITEKLQGKALALFIGKALVSLGLSLVCYLLLNKLLLTLSHSAMLSQQGMDKMGQIEIGKLPHQMALAYQKFLDYFFFSPMEAYRKVGKLAQAAVVVGSFAGLIYMAVRLLCKGHVWEGCVVVLCLAVLPMAASGIYLMTTNDVNAHHHTLYPYIPVMLLPAVFSLEKQMIRRKALGAAALAVTMGLCCLLGYEYAVVDNQAHFRTYLAQTRAENFANRLFSRIEADPEYQPGCKVYFAGQLSGGEDALIYYESDDVIRFSRMMFHTPYEQSYFENCVGQQLMRNVMGMPIALDYLWVPTEDEQAQLAQMPCYPAEGSIRLMGDTYIVKFSD